MIKGMVVTSDNDIFFDINSLFSKDDILYSGFSKSGVAGYLQKWCQGLYKAVHG